MEQAALIKITPDGDRAARVEFGTAIAPDVNRQVHAFCAAIDAERIAGVVETTPAFATAAVYYSPLTISYATLVDRLTAVGNTIEPADVAAGRIVEIPVAYGGEFGPDLAAIAQSHGLTVDEAVDLHSGTDYLCYMIGFMPGFPYLGQVDPRLRTPRLSTPRTRVAAGSVAIADAQTGIYPRETPGGWNIIGRTPIRLFDADADPPSRIRPGDTVRFVPIDTAAFQSWHRYQDGQDISSS